MKEQEEIQTLSLEEIESVSGGGDIPPPDWFWDRWLRPPWEHPDPPASL